MSRSTVWPEPIWIKVKTSWRILSQHQSTYLMSLVAHQFGICICFDFFNCACLKKTITNIRYLEFDTSKSMSYQGHKRPRICINWNPSFKPKIYLLKGQLPRWILWNKIYLMKTVFKNLMKRGILMNPILIDADSGPLVFVSKFLLLFRPYCGRVH